jgi:sugar phosphate isomerase/epimerase
MHERLSVNTLCFMGTPFSELLSYWRELAPRRLGLMTAPIFEEGLEAARAAIATGDYRVDVLSHQFLAGELSPDEASWAEPRERLSQAIAMGRELGARCLYMASGGHAGRCWEEAAEAFCAAIAPCLPEAEGAGIKLLVEPCNPLYVTSHLAHNLRDTITLAEMAGIGVSIDIPACWTDAGLKQLIERAMPICHLFQLGDWCPGDRSLPCRAVPGDGVIPLGQILGWALDAGFEGAFDLELLGPRIDAEGRVKAVARAAEHVGNILISLGV